ncbi:MAG: hypothetical protein PHI73_04230 [Patescibacteria group bacterium]|nr:hypothetical protein [Patescibacteria group bacterium]
MNNQPEKLPEKLTLNDQIRKDIEDKKITMKPKSYFWLRKLLIVLAFFGIIIIGTFFGSLIHFSLQSRGLWGLPEFSASYWQNLFQSFPWFIFGTAILFLLALFVILRRYFKGYRFPLIIFTALILVSVCVIGSVVIYFDFHSKASHYILEEDIPIIKSIYHCPGIEEEDYILTGIIQEVHSGDLTIRDSSGQTRQVIIWPETSFIDSDGIGPHQGGVVVIWGRQMGDKIDATRIRELNYHDLNNLPERLCP